MIGLLSRLRNPSEIHSVEPGGDGFGIIAKPDRLSDFSMLVRDAINDPDPSYAVFATRMTEGTERLYERAYILPFDE
jgi:hypothetical protein